LNDAGYNPGVSLEDHSKERPGGLLLVIVALKAGKSAIFLATAIMMMFYRRDPMTELLKRWAEAADGDPRLEFTAQFLRDLSHIFELHFSGIIMACMIAAIFLAAEALCLWMGYTWAPWFAIVLTGMWLPLELYEMVIDFTRRKAILFAVNLAIVVYLYRHRKEFHHRPHDEDLARAAA